MANEAQGAFGYLWFQQKGTKRAGGVLVPYVCLKALKRADITGP